MLDIDMEFRKGILFVRLTGSFLVDSYTLLDDKLKELVDNNNVKFITFNVSGLENIDAMGINTLLKYNKVLSKNKGKALICGVDNDLVKLKVYDSRVPYFMYEARDELGAINYINLGGYL
ncbi:MAG: STAS domain-containing protein [Bacilli bacterium]|jgi:anti-anti-sigma factor